MYSLLSTNSRSTSWDNLFANLEKEGDQIESDLSLRNMVLSYLNLPLETSENVLEDQVTNNAKAILAHKEIKIFVDNEESLVECVTTVMQRHIDHKNKMKRLKILEDTMLTSYKRSLLSAKVGLFGASCSLFSYLFCSEEKEDGRRHYSNGGTALLLGGLSTAVACIAPTLQQAVKSVKAMNEMRRLLTDAPSSTHQV